MKTKIVTYWIATPVLSGFMAMSAYMYLTGEPKIVSSFRALGYPDYFRAILGVAKILGAIALLVPGLPRLKEWAYAGFTFTFLGAICSHLALAQNVAALMPFMSLVILAVSYVCRPDERRVPAESEADVHRHLGGGLQAH